MRDRRVDLTEVVVREALVKHGGSVRVVMKELHCCFNTLHERIERYGLSKLVVRKRLVCSKRGEAGEEPKVCWMCGKVIVEVMGELEERKRVAEGKLTDEQRKRAVAWMEKIHSRGAREEFVRGERRHLAAMKGAANRGGNGR